MRPIRLGGRGVAVGLILTGGFLAAGALPAPAQTGAEPAPNPAVMKPETVPLLSGNHFNAVAMEPL